jgi:rhodanese-related sulfurtransferase
MNRLTTARCAASALSLLRALLVAAALTWTGPVLSVESAKPSVPKVKKSKPPVPAKSLELTPAPPQPASDCTLDALDPQTNRSVIYSVRLPAPGSKQRVSACLLPAKQAIQQARKSELLLVDVRTARSYERYRVAGSLNIPIAFVKTKSFLKPQAFALVNEGRESSELEAMCQELRAQGFSRAVVLQGGLNAWRKAKGVIDGDLLAQRELTHMHHAEFAAEGNYADWIVVSIATVPVKDVQSLLPQAVSVPPVEDSGKLAAAVKSAVAKRARKGTESKVLVVDDDGARYDRIENDLAAVLPQSLYFLDGGLKGYRKFWSEQATIWAAAAKPPRKPACGA